MGRKTEFSDQQIIDSGLSLEKEKKSVSPFAIRNKLGGGSSERIKAVWSTYDTNRASEQVLEQSNETIDLPVEIQNILEKNIKSATGMFAKLASDGYHVAQLVAEKRVTSTIKEYEAKITTFEESEYQAFLAIEDSDRRTDALELELIEYKNKFDELLAENSRQTGMAESLRERIKLLERKEEEFSSLQREYGRLEERVKLLSKKSQ
jgi:predicted RNase H-like nuclease (RuvC/YqgF family)